MKWDPDKNKNDSEFVIETLPYYSKPCMAGSNILLDLFFQNDGGIVFNIWARMVCGVPYSAYFIFSLFGLKLEHLDFKIVQSFLFYSEDYRLLYFNQ